MVIDKINYIALIEKKLVKIENKYLRKSLFKKKEY